MTTYVLIFIDASFHCTHDPAQDNNTNDDAGDPADGQGNTTKCTECGKTSAAEYQKCALNILYMKQLAFLPVPVDMASYWPSVRWSGVVNCTYNSSLSIFCLCSCAGPNTLSQLLTTISTCLEMTRQLAMTSAAHSLQR